MVVSMNMQLMDRKAPMITLPLAASRTNCLKEMRSKFQEPKERDLAQEQLVEEVRTPISCLKGLLTVN